MGLVSRFVIGSMAVGTMTGGRFCGRGLLEEERNIILLLSST